MLFDVPFDAQHPKFYRAAIRQQGNDVAVLEIGYNCVPPKYHRIMKRNAYIIHYVVGGKGVYMNCPFDQSCGYMVAPNELESITADQDDPYETYWIRMRGSLVPKLLADCGLPAHNAVFQFNRTADCGNIIHRFLFEEQSKNEAAEACLLQATLYELLAIHLEEQASITCPAPSDAQKVADFLEKNYQENILIRDVAERFFLSPNHMYTLFKKEYGVSPQEYLLSLRVEKAKQFLHHPDEKLPIKAIAASVGFENALYFTRYFHQRVGQSPSDYRKKFQLNAQPRGKENG